MSKLPFGLKAPSRGTVIFGSIVATISATTYASYHFANEARRAHCNRVSFLAERPCGVHEMPRKVVVYIMPPPGDSMEKSRVWFREYIKPVLVAGAVDYALKEGREPGQIETAVRDEILKLKRQAAQPKETEEEPFGNDNEEKGGNPFAPMMKKVQKKIKAQDRYDGVLVIGRSAWREVLSGLEKGCNADPNAIEEAKPEAESTQATETSQAQETNENQATDAQHTEAVQEESLEAPVEPTLEPALESSPDAYAIQEKEQEEHFSIPPSMSPVLYIPHENIIGWTNLPYRLFMWIADYKRVDTIGRYGVAAVLNETRPLKESEINQGEHEKVYWIGDDAKVIKENDQPITLDERIRSNLRTYTNAELLP